MPAIIYKTTKEYLRRFKIADRDGCNAFQVFDVIFTIAPSDWYASTIFYLHCYQNEAGLMDRIQCMTTKRFEFGFLPEQDLSQAIKGGANLQNQNLEEDSMFSNYTIKSFELGEIDPVALEVAIKGWAKGRDGVKLVQKGEAVYMVKEGTGKSIELGSEKFEKLIRSYVEGKSVAELAKNSDLFELIKSLGVIKEVTLASEEAGLGDFFD